MLVSLVGCKERPIDMAGHKAARPRMHADAHRWSLFLTYLCASACIRVQNDFLDKIALVLLIGRTEEASRTDQVMKNQRKSSVRASNAIRYFIAPIIRSFRPGFRPRLRVGISGLIACQGSSFGH